MLGTLAILSGVLQVAGYVLYIKKTLGKEINPNPTSWLMWAYGTTLVLVLELDRNAGWEILLLPFLCAVYVYLFMAESAVWLIPFIHAAVFVSDVLDGLTADVFDQHSRLGTRLDPIRDRLHSLATLANLAIVSDSGAVLAALAVTIAAESLLAAHAYRGLASGAHRIGKMRAAAHGIAGSLALVSVYWFDASLNLDVIASGMALASVIAAVFYIRRAYTQPSGRMS